MRGAATRPAASHARRSSRVVVVAGPRRGRNMILPELSVTHPRTPARVRYIEPPERRGGTCMGQQGVSQRYILRRWWAWRTEGTWAARQLGAVTAASAELARPRPGSSDPASQQPRPQRVGSQLLNGRPHTASTACPVHHGSSAWGGAASGEHQEPNKAPDLGALTRSRTPILRVLVQVL